jgi:hypothetical protein
LKSLPQRSRIGVLREEPETPAATFRIKADERGGHEKRFAKIRAYVKAKLAAQLLDHMP